MSDSSTKRVWNWDEVRQHAERRPSMYIGEPATAHQWSIQSCLRLVWQAKVFRRPQSVTIDLSPTQYIVRAECGPLIRPIQQHFSFGSNETLGKSWPKEMQAYNVWGDAKNERKGNSVSGRRYYDWRYCFSGPTGPRLNQPAYPSILARQLAWGLRTNSGLWCETYKDGKPVARPFCLEGPSSVGLMVAADLDPQWFTGLPFTEADVVYFTELSGRRFVSQPKYEPQPLWTPGEIVAHWHPQDDLVSERTLTPDGLTELIKASV